jgi:transposase InsO family protein
MLAHCAATMEMAVGITLPPRRFVGRILGPLVKKAIIQEGKPFRRNSSSDKSLIIKEDRDFETERQRLRELLERFAAAGPEGCTRHPHSFFGPLTPMEWASFMYLHLDHHLQQFGV